MQIIMDDEIEKFISSRVVAGNIKATTRGAGVRKIAEELPQRAVSVK